MSDSGISTSRSSPAHRCSIALLSGTLLLLVARGVGAQTLCNNNGQCNDNNPCTDDACVSLVCVHTPNTNPCTDSNACTQGDTCVAGLCVSGVPTICSDNDVCNGVETCNPTTGACEAGTPLNCNDGLACTQDSCNATLGCLHTPIQNCCTTNVQCDDGSVCNGAETCNTATGTCTPGVPLVCVDGNLCTQDGCDPATGCTFTPIGGCCLTPLDCNDGDGCTTDTCDLLNHVCSHAARDCSDGNVCTGAETCNNATGNCAPGTALDCDDGSACTVDACVPLLGCTNVAIPGCCSSSTQCDDHDACNGPETCDPNLHVCLPGVPLLCGNANVCDGQESCNSATGCVGGTPLDCDDGLLCTMDICSPATGCLSVPIPGCCLSDADCDDSNACNGTETCVDAKCQSGPPTGCDDGNPCTEDVCLPLLGCEHLPAVATCDDGDPCTVGDICLNGQCLSGVPTPCSDANICNGVETCNPATGACAGGTALNCDDGLSCTTDTCLPLIGCVPTSVPSCCTDNASCEDGNVCNGAGTCQTDTGLCLPGLPLLCVDGDACTTDGCNPAGGCTFTPLADCCNADAQCNDDNACTTDLCNPVTHVCHHFALPCTDLDPCNGAETCNPLNGQCEVGTPPVCDDGVACTSDACVPLLGCTHIPGPSCCTADADCDDHDACTGQETCLVAAGLCLPGIPLLCDNLNPCDGTESCNPATGCQTGTPLDCDDGVACTLDPCLPIVGCTHVPVPGCCMSDTACDDHDQCSGRETCTVFTCLPGSPLSCDDNNVCTDDSCVAGPGCMHTVNGTACADLRLERTKLRGESAGLSNGRILGRGSFLTPPTFTGTPPITLRIQDGTGLDLSHTFASCTPRHGGALCRDAVGVLGIKPTKKTPGTFRFKFRLVGLAIDPPFAGPVTVTVSHDGRRRADIIVECKRTSTGLSCRRRRR